MTDLTPKQQELFDTMSDISEECYCAGWMMGNEYTIWGAILTGDLRYGMGEIDPVKLKKCKALSGEIDGWIVWLDDDDVPELPNEEWGPIFISMADWLQKFENLLSPALSGEIDGWIVWLDDDDVPELPNEEWGPIFISMADWLQTDGSDMNLQDYIDKWNAKADEHNQWAALDCDEKLEWVIQCMNEPGPEYRCTIDDGYDDCVLDGSGNYIPSDCPEAERNGYKKPGDCPYWEVCRMSEDYFELYKALIDKIATLRDCIKWDESKELDNGKVLKMINCKCKDWARSNIYPLTHHHPNCPHYDLAGDATQIINALLDGIVIWAGDEDGVHDACWEAFKNAACFVGRMEIIK